MLANAEERKATFASVRTEVNSRLMVIHTNLDVVKALFKANI